MLQSIFAELNALMNMPYRAYPGSNIRSNPMQYILVKNSNTGLSPPW